MKNLLSSTNSANNIINPLQPLKAEDDSITVNLDGQRIQIEQANQVMLSGKLQWTDSAGNQHPIREATVEIWDDDTFIAGGDKKVKTISTDANGFYSTTFDNDDGIGQGNRDIYIKVFADSSFHLVQNTKSDIYLFQSDVLNEIPDGTNTLNITIPNNTTVGRAFSVNDAVYTSEKFAEILGVPISKNSRLKINFPARGDFFRLKEKDLNISSVSRWAWDVIHHEYGHFLANLDGLDNYPNDLPNNFQHSFGLSNIPSLGKDRGVRVGWGEGLASYLGIASQFVAASFLPAVPSVGNTFYDSINADDSTKNFSVDLETNSGSGNAGESDEASVARILWDIADGRNEPHDRIALGHNVLYGILNNQIPNLAQLDNVWDYFFNNSNDATRVDYGAIFEQYQVSPAPRSGPIGQTFRREDTIPTFQWAKNNNNANNQFQCLVFSTDFSTRQLDSGNLGDVTTWTPTQDQWNQVINNPGNYHFIIAGSDTNVFSTGAYWSGAYDFTIALPPNLATLLSDGQLRLNMGTFASDRNVSPGVIDENFFIANNVTVSAFGERETYSGVTNIIADGNTGDDTIVIDADISTRLDGGAGNDKFTGGTQNDLLSGGSEDDILNGREGYLDKMFGGENDDRIEDRDGVLGAHGGMGNDAIAVTFVDTWDNDTNPKNGPRSDGKITGGYGDDDITVTMNDAKFFVNLKGDEPASNKPEDGNDTVTLQGSYANSIVDLGGGDDIFNGDRGNDNISGKNGNDSLFGLGGNDQLAGDWGNDLLRGGSGKDRLIGGGNDDTFVLAKGEGIDTIVDFQVELDFIGLTDGLTFGQLSITQSNTNTLINSGNETLAILNGITASNLLEERIVLV
jgi:Ca2+-binding RTX toxin-like protein